MSILSLPKKLLIFSSRLFLVLVLYIAMDSNTTLVIFAVLAATALVGATAAYIIIPANAALPDQFGRCKYETNAADQACRNTKGD